MATFKGKCEKHQRKPWTNKSQNTLQLSSNDRKHFREQVLTREPNCRACGQPATEADHIVPISQGGSHDDPANGQALCTSCHQRKTIAERAKNNS